MAKKRKRRRHGFGAGMGRLVGFVAASILCGILAASLVVPAVAAAGMGVSTSIGFFESLPAELNVQPPSQATKVLTADGQQIATFYAENRVKVPLDQMSPFIKDGIIAVEDSRFYEHAGVDPQGILRALVSNLTKGGEQGASTITQQYVTNVLNEAQLSQDRPDAVVLNGQKTLGDKLREMKLAVTMERKYTKDQILEGYLNIVFFSSNAYGIEAAARYFFSTNAKDLTLPEAALLAGLVNSPALYNPATNPDKSIARRNHVLSEMLRLGKISQAQHDEAVATPIQLKITPSNRAAPMRTWRRTSAITFPT